MRLRSHLHPRRKRASAGLRLLRGREGAPHSNAAADALKKGEWRQHWKNYGGTAGGEFRVVGAQTSFHPHLGGGLNFQRVKFPLRLFWIGLG